MVHEPQFGNASGRGTLRGPLKQIRKTQCKTSLIACLHIKIIQGPSSCQHRNLYSPSSSPILSTLTFFLWPARGINLCMLSMYTTNYGHSLFNTPIWAETATGIYCYFFFSMYRCPGLFSVKMWTEILKGGGQSYLYLTMPFLENLVSYTGTFNEDSMQCYKLKIYKLITKWHHVCPESSHIQHHWMSMSSCVMKG